MQQEWRNVLGDSGGPILIPDSVAGDITRGRPEKDQIVGINSFGRGECNGQMPDVYTKVPYFLDWIWGTVEKVIPVSSPSSLS